MCICEPVNFTMELNAHGHCLRVRIEIASLYKITNEVTHDHFFGWARKVDVCKEVQFNIRIVLYQKHSLRLIPVSLENLGLNNYF